jgi:hypothetical protein
VAYNNATVRGRRHTLHLSRSFDSGRSWRLVTVLKEAKVRSGPNGGCSSVSHAEDLERGRAKGDYVLSDSCVTLSAARPKPTNFM